MVNSMEKLNGKQKKIVIISSICMAIVIVTIVFLVLGLTVWNKKEQLKTTAEWLNDFAASLSFDKHLLLMIMIYLHL